MPKKTNHEKQGGKIISTLNFPLFFILFSRQWPGPAPPIFFYQPHLPFSFPSGKMKKKKDVGWKRYGGAEAEPVFHINFAFDPSATPGEGEINMKKNRLALRNSSANGRAFFFYVPNLFQPPAAMVSNSKIKISWPALANFPLSVSESK